MPEKYNEGKMTRVPESGEFEITMLNSILYFRSQIR